MVNPALFDFVYSAVREGVLALPALRGHWEKPHKALIHNEDMLGLDALLRHGPVHLESRPAPMWSQKSPEATLFTA